MAIDMYTIYRCTAWNTVFCTHHFISLFQVSLRIGTEIPFTLMFLNAPRPLAHSQLNEKEESYALNSFPKRLHLSSCLQC